MATVRNRWPFCHAEPAAAILDIATVHDFGVDAERVGGAIAEEAEAAETRR